MPRQLKDAKQAVIDEEFLKAPSQIETLKANSEITVIRNMPDLIWIKFRNMLDPGLPLQFFFCDETAGIPLTNYCFEHDKVHPDPVPRVVVDWINDRKIPISKKDHTARGSRSCISSYKYLYQCLEVKGPR